VSEPVPLDGADPTLPTRSNELHPPWESRGTEFGRIFGLSDGIFAFSMTLLVLTLVIPLGTNESNLGMYLQRPTFLTAMFAYVITFFVIAQWWRTHHLQFGYLRSYDRRLLQFNTLFLIFIAVLPFAMQVLNVPGKGPEGTVFFAAIQVATGLALAGTWAYASGMGHLAPNLPKAWERYITYTTFSVPVVFAVSIPLAYVIGQSAEYLWAAVFILPTVLRRSISA
jgi:TMEM175 potassium channel family protein